MSVSVIVCAAGKGVRSGFEKNKLLMPFDGVPVLKRTLRAFDYARIDEIIVTYSPCDYEEIRELVSDISRVKLVEGGETRAHSVFNAIQSVSADIVLIHDGARPFVSRELIEGCIRSVETHGSGICAVPCTDTMAVKSTTNEIVRVPDRNLLARIQTPQGFYTKDILSAYQQAFETGKLHQATIKDGEKKDEQIVHTRKASQYTDDSSIYLDFIGFPTLCDGAEENKKLTYARDFQSVVRCGVGIDTHAFGKTQDFITLAGVRIPSESGLIAHSDGDVLVHALMDAMLSACGLKDIGHYFPDTDEKWKNANSMDMLAQVRQMITEHGYVVKNASIAIQAETPRLAKFMDSMQENLANALGVDKQEIGITAGTCEGLGFVGEGKGITVTCFVLIKEI